MLRSGSSSIFLLTSVPFLISSAVICRLPVIIAACRGGRLKYASGMPLPFVFTYSSVEYSIFDPSNFIRASITAASPLSIMSKIASCDPFSFQPWSFIVLNSPRSFKPLSGKALRSCSLSEFLSFSSIFISSFSVFLQGLQSHASSFSMTDLFALYSLYLGLRMLNGGRSSG